MWEEPKEKIDSAAFGRKSKLLIFLVNQMLDRGEQLQLADDCAGRHSFALFDDIFDQYRSSADYKAPPEVNKSSSYRHQKGSSSDFNFGKKEVRKL